MTAAPAVLVVEDEKAVRDSVARVLRSDGVRIDFARDVAAALAHPWLKTCDAVLCDLKLPDGSGLDLLKVFRSRRPSVPFIVTTGFATTDTLAEAWVAGATDILLKPFDCAELSYVVLRAVSPDARFPEDKP
jgi:DNA-binding NtrC family response regulator